MIALQGEVRDLISKAQIKIAIKLLQDTTINNEDELALFLMELSMLDKAERIGVISFDIYQSRLKKLANSILQLTTIIIREEQLLELKQEDTSIANEPSTKYGQELTEKWFALLSSFGWKITCEDLPYADFIVFAQNKEIYFEVKNIQNIGELKNKSKYIKPEITGTSLSNCIVLGNGPFLNDNHFYQNMQSIQIGWIFNYDGNFWDEIMLKNNFDISNTNQAIYNLFGRELSHKAFMPADSYSSITSVWNNKLK